MHALAMVCGSSVLPASVPALSSSHASTLGLPVKPAALMTNDGVLARRNSSNTSKRV